MTRALQYMYAQGSNFWNLYTADTADDDPYRITLDDGSTMGIINSHVSFLAHALHAVRMQHAPRHQEG